MRSAAGRPRRWRRRRRRRPGLQARRPLHPARANDRRQFSRPCPWPWSYKAPRRPGVSGRLCGRGLAAAACRAMQIFVWRTRPSGNREGAEQREATGALKAAAADKAAGTFRQQIWLLCNRGKQHCRPMGRSWLAAWEALRGLSTAESWAQNPAEYFAWHKDRICFAVRSCSRPAASCSQLPTQLVAETDAHP